MIEYIVYGVLILTFVLGAFLYWKSSSNSSVYYSKKKNVFQGLKDSLEKSLEKSGTDTLIRQTGFNVSGLTYQVIRYIVAIVWLCYLIYKRLALEYDVTMDIALLVLVYLASSPRKLYFGFTSPFVLFVNQMLKNRRYKYNAEIYRCLSLLKNLAVTKYDRAFSSVYIIEELTKYTVFSKPIFNRLLGYWYESRFDEGKEYFKEAVGTDLGSSLVELFQHIDGLKPGELVNQIDLYQQKAKDALKTRAHKVKELKSVGIYAVVIITGMIILLNFLAVSIFIDLFQGFKSIHY